MEYADDCDFLNENAEADRVITLEISRLLKKENLVLNDDKTEKTLLERETDKNKESWRMVKKLGSLLGDAEDVIRRIQLASVAMTKINKVWIRGKESPY